MRQMELQMYRLSRKVSAKMTRSKRLNCVSSAHTSFMMDLALGRSNTEVETMALLKHFGSF